MAPAPPKRLTALTFGIAPVWPPRPARRCRRCNTFGLRQADAGFRQRRTRSVNMRSATLTPEPKRCAVRIEARRCRGAARRANRFRGSISIATRSGRVDDARSSAWCRSSARAVIEQRRKAGAQGEHLQLFLGGFAIIICCGSSVASMIWCTHAPAVTSRSTPGGHALSRAVSPQGRQHGVGSPAGGLTRQIWRTRRWATSRERGRQHVRLDAHLHQPRQRRRWWWQSRPAQVAGQRRLRGDSAVAVAVSTMTMSGSWRRMCFSMRAKVRPVPR
jgi:hypothetical protein